jgi:hypothetical protein
VPKLGFGQHYRRAPGSFNVDTECIQNEAASADVGRVIIIRMGKDYQIRRLRIEPFSKAINIPAPVLFPLLSEICFDFVEAVRMIGHKKVETQDRT